MTRERVDFEIDQECSLCNPKGVFEDLASFVNHLDKHKKSTTSTEKFFQMQKLKDLLITRSNTKVDKLIRSHSSDSSNDKLIQGIPTRQRRKSQEPVDPNDEREGISTPFWLTLLNLNRQPMHRSSLLTWYDAVQGDRLPQGQSQVSGCLCQVCSQSFLTDEELDAHVLSYKVP